MEKHSERPDRHRAVHARRELTRLSRPQAATAPGALGRLLAALRESSPAMRLLAARCLVALARALPEDAAPHSPEARRCVPCVWIQGVAGALRKRVNFLHCAVVPSCACGSGALPADARGPSADRARQAVRRAVLPVLVKLLGCTPVREGVPGALAALLEDCPALHRAAADADAIGRLAAFLRDERCPARLKARRGGHAPVPCQVLRFGVLRP